LPEVEWPCEVTAKKWRKHSIGTTTRSLLAMFSLGSAVVLLFRRYFGLTHLPISLLKGKKNQRKHIYIWTAVPYEQLKNENKLVSFKRRISSRPFRIRSVRSSSRKLPFFHYCSSCYCFRARGIVAVVCFIILSKAITPFMSKLTRAASWSFHIEVHPIVITFTSFWFSTSFDLCPCFKSSFKAGSKILVVLNFRLQNGPPHCFV